MNSSVEKTTTSLAVVEKKPHRPGGCVGVFFQLFDWNRRLAKKKLFSKKLLSSGRLKEAASKKFGGDEKQPKLRLIADENSGGFPTAKNGNFGLNFEENGKMRSPGLVARLMGLESLPAVNKQKSKKVPESGVDSADRHFKKDLNVDKGGINHEARPQKLQKTNVCERRSVTKFGAEALPLKNVLSKSRKHHHHPKLPSPVKSPRNLSRKSLSTLIGAATRILEPGLQSNNLKGALTYSNAFHNQPRSTDLEERTKFVSSRLDGSNGFVNIPNEGLSSFENCGNLHDHTDTKPEFSKHQLVFPSPFPGSCVVDLSQKFDEELHENYPTTASSAVDNRQSRAKYTSDVSSYSRQTQQYSGNEQFDRQKNVALPLNSAPAMLFQDKKLWTGEEFALRSKSNGLRSRKVAKTTIIDGKMNLSQLGAARKDYGRFELQKRTANTQNMVVPPRQKKRTANVSGQVANSSSINSVRNWQLYNSHYAVSGNKLGYHSNKMSRQSCNGHPQIQERTVDNGQVENNDASFSFKSRGKQKNRIYEPVKRKVHNNNLGCESSSRKLASREIDPWKKAGESLPLSGDALSALLEQKLKELNCQEDDLKDNAPKKTTAMILQELISALTSDVPFYQDKVAAISDESKSHFSESTSSSNFQVNKVVNLSPDQPLDTEHLSPGSVLEACFSNDSCLSSSVDGSIGDKIHTESLNFPSHGSQSPCPDTGLVDCRTLINTGEIIRNVSEILCCNNLANSGLKGRIHNRAKEILVNAEVVCRSCTVLGKGSTIKHLVCDELDTLTSVLWMNFGSCLGTEDGKEVNQLKGFAFDSVIEYLDIQFANYEYNGRRKVSMKFPLCMNTKSLMLEIVEEVRRWKQLSRFVLDDLIDREMGRSLQEWTLFETECFETGLEISRDLFQVLVDEIVTDLWNC